MSSIDDDQATLKLMQEFYQYMTDHYTGDNVELIPVLKCNPGCQNHGTFIVVYSCPSQHVFDTLMCAYHKENIIGKHCMFCAATIIASKNIPYDKKYYNRYSQNTIMPGWAAVNTHDLP